MSRLPQVVLSVLFVFAAQVVSRAQSTSSPTPQLTMTSGIVGVTSTQSAQVNVLNLQPVIQGVTAVACPVTLEFYDNTGALLKSMAFTTVSPANSVSLVFKPTVPTAAVNSRAQIRAVVAAPLPTITPVVINSGTNLVSTSPVSPGCSLASSLEITDDATGVTQILTTDFRSMLNGVLSAVILPGPIAQQVR